MKIKELWEKIENGEVVHWQNVSYRVRSIPSNESKYQKNHFTYKDGKVLVIVHDEGYQSILGKSEIKDLYS